MVSSLSQLPSLSHATSPGASSTSNFLASFCHLTKPTQFFILRLMFPDLPRNCTCVKPYIFYPLTASEEALCIAQTKNRKALTHHKETDTTHFQVLKYLRESGRVTGLFPWHKHIATILQRSPVNAGMCHVPCPEKVERGPGDADTKHSAAPSHRQRQHLHPSQAGLAGGNVSCLEGCRSAFESYQQYTS